jgi:RNA polymerase sigma-70 factor, ECF subfamily
MSFTTATPEFCLNVVHQVCDGDSGNTFELYGLVSLVASPMLHRETGHQNADDYLHDVFIIVLQAVQRGCVRDPGALPGFIYTVARRQAYRHIESLMFRRAQFVSIYEMDFLLSEAQNPEEMAIEQQRVEIAMDILRTLSVRDFSVLDRFYYKRQHPDVICRDLGLTKNQFRNIKSQAKARAAARFSQLTAAVC